MPSASSQMGGAGADGLQRLHPQGGWGRNGSEIRALERALSVPALLHPRDATRFWTTSASSRGRRSPGAAR